MTKGFTDKFELCRKDDNGADSASHCNTALQNGKMCIESDFCRPTPREINNGILTMAFVDMQPLENVYSTETAFCNGTLFPNLNKPFFGGACG